MTSHNTIAIYGSHDASVTFVDKTGKLRIYEYERFTKKRYAMFSSMFDDRSGMGSNDTERRQFLNLLKQNLIDTNIQHILYAQLNTSDINLLKEYFPNAEFEAMDHHFSHAYSGLYSSGFKKSLLFSVDGGGVDNNVVTTTKIYKTDNEKLEEIHCNNPDYGNPYSAVAFLISEIKPGAEGEGCENSLVYAGKIMGLCAYGEVRQDWVAAFDEYYNHKDLRKLCSNINIPYGYNSVSEKVGYDLAATSQFVFEKKMNELVLPLVFKYHLNVILVGGCALNVLYNQKLYEILKTKNLNLFVPPNPNDCGQSCGMFLSKFFNENFGEFVYNGLEILDNDKLSEYEAVYESEEFSFHKIVDYLKKGKIIGILHGHSEVGPRALGNRSIICDPSFPKMKDILNAKVKFREWYRPFAPVCRVEDKDMYFENACESQYMSYAPLVKSEFKDSLCSIVHADNSSRLQTTTKEQNKMFYGILTELNLRNETAVILNTSFNVRGFPILTSLEDAFYVLDNTELDFVVTNNKIFKKK